MKAVVKDQLIAKCKELGIAFEPDWSEKDFAKAIAEKVEDEQLLEDDATDLKKNGGKKEEAEEEKAPAEVPEGDATPGGNKKSKYFAVMKCNVRHNGKRYYAGTFYELDPDVYKTFVSQDFVTVTKS